MDQKSWRSWTYSEFLVTYQVKRSLYLGTLQIVKLPDIEYWIRRIHHMSLPRLNVDSIWQSFKIWTTHLSIHVGTKVGTLCRWVCWFPDIIGKQKDAVYKYVILLVSFHRLMRYTRLEDLRIPLDKGLGWYRYMRDNQLVLSFLVGPDGFLQQKSDLYLRSFSAEEIILSPINTVVLALVFRTSETTRSW